MQPRGIRNNNPLNLRIGNDWIGEVQFPSDPVFEQFNSMLYGLRAGMVVLRRYILHYRRDNISKIITSWAPSNENDTQRYIDVVSGRMRLEENKTIRWSDKDQIVDLVSAMCYVETGCNISRDLIRQAYDMVRL